MSVSSTAQDLVQLEPASCVGLPLDSLLSWPDGLADNLAACLAALSPHNRPPGRRDWTLSTNSCPVAAGSPAPFTSAPRYPFTGRQAKGVILPQGGKLASSVLGPPLPAAGSEAPPRRRPPPGSAPAALAGPPPVVNARMRTGAGGVVVVCVEAERCAEPNTARAEPSYFASPAESTDHRRLLPLQMLRPLLQNQRLLMQFLRFLLHNLPHRCFVRRLRRAAGCPQLLLASGVGMRLRAMRPVPAAGAAERVASQRAGGDAQHRRSWQHHLRVDLHGAAAGLQARGAAGSARGADHASQRACPSIILPSPPLPLLVDGHPGMTLSLDSQLAA